MSLGWKDSGLFGGSSIGLRQIPLQAEDGFTGNGMVTISPDHVFSAIVHLPPLQTANQAYPAIYATYLVDDKGTCGFYAGSLRPAGHGIFQLVFRSHVPLVHFTKVVISIEDPRTVGQWPQGPIVLKVKESLAEGLAPVKKVGSDLWGKVNGFVKKRMGNGREETAVPPAPVAPQYYQDAYSQPPQQPVADVYQNPPTAPQYMQEQADYQQYPVQDGQQYNVSESEE